MMPSTRSAAIVSFDRVRIAACAMIPSGVSEQVQRELQEGRLERYRMRADPAIAVVSAFYLVLLLVPRVAITSLESSRVIFALDIVFWAILVADVAYRVSLTSDRRARLYGLLGLALLMTGPLVLLRISADTRDLIRLALIAVVAFRAVNSIKFFFRLRSILYLSCAVFLIVLAFGVSMTATERNDTNANIKSLSDGLWWAVVTVSTVGYGDKFPVSNSGRVIASGLMFIGVALFSILTATLATSFVARSAASDSDQLERIHDRLERIEQNQLSSTAGRRLRSPRRPRRATPPPRVSGELTSKE